MTLDGEFPVFVHKAGDGAIFCSLVDGEGETFFPDDIERIEVAMAQAERSRWGDEMEFEEILPTEAERNEEPPQVGTVRYVNGERVEMDFDLTGFEVAA